MFLVFLGSHNLQGRGQPLPDFNLPGGCFLAGSMGSLCINCDPCRCEAGVFLS